MKDKFRRRYASMGRFPERGATAPKSVFLSPPAWVDRRKDLAAAWDVEHYQRTVLDALESNPSGCALGFNAPIWVRGWDEADAKIHRLMTIEALMQTGIRNVVTTSTVAPAPRIPDLVDRLTELMEAIELCEFGKGWSKFSKPVMPSSEDNR